VEVEAYTHTDPASHAFGGKTKRNAVMFDGGGKLYVYFTYGMHFCANVVTGRQNVGEAVLIRGVEPVAGLECMFLDRYGHSRPRSRRELIQLTNGPAKVCQAFGIDLGQNGCDLRTGPVFILRPERRKRLRIGTSRRIGITKGVWRRWRWYERGNAWVGGM
jgi:DNA-3-methyladenine glycosylase